MKHLLLPCAVLGMCFMVFQPFTISHADGSPHTHHHEAQEVCHGHHDHGDHHHASHSHDHCAHEEEHDCSGHEHVLMDSLTAIPYSFQALFCEREFPQDLVPCPEVSPPLVLKGRLERPPRFS